MERREAFDMKTMTRKDLTRVCELKLHAETFNEIAKMSKKHRMEMFDQAHVDAMEKMKALKP